MTGRRVRLIAACITMLVALQCALPAMAEGTLNTKNFDQVADWLWGVPGSPNAVRTRFNALASSFSGDAKISQIANVSPVTPNGTFTLYQKDENTAMQAGNARFSLSGRIMESGKVDRLTLVIDPSGSVNDAYLSACDQLMRVTMLSLFEKLSDREVREATLTYAYDVRPFANKGINNRLSKKNRSVSTVIDGTSVTLSASARSSGRIQFEIRLGKAASSGQIRKASTNNACNRNLSQAITECADLLSCVRGLEKQAALSRPNWRAIDAISTQLGEGLDVLNKLSDKLRPVSKARAYAVQLKKKCAAFELLNSSLSTAAEDKENSTVDLTKLVAEMRDCATETSQLSSMLWK